MFAREQHEQALATARMFHFPHTVIGFANNGSFQALQTYFF